jgi:SAM-dependent methyltransferase
LDFAKAFNANCTASIALLHKDAATFQLPELADLMLCIGVLQYCPDDVAVLQNMKSQLKPDGKLLLYVPVNGREILPFYRWLRARWPDYESIQSRQRVYRVAEIEAKLANAGFKLSNRKFTYGTLGILSNEWLNSFFLVMVHGSILLKVLATFLFGLTWPLMLLAMLSDFLQSHKNGNCLLMVAESN